MKLKLLLGLALGLSALTATIASAQPQSGLAKSGDANNAAHDWGESVRGFQMAASSDETSGIIHCWIRNATTHEMGYPSVGFFGHRFFVKLEILVATNWIKLNPWVFPGVDYIAENNPYEGKTIKRGQIITNNSNFQFRRNELSERAQTRPVVDDPVFNLLVHKVDLHYMALSNLCSGHTYALDFVVRNPVFSYLAKSGLTNPPPLIKGRVCQEFPDGKTGFLRLHSPAFDCPTFKPYERLEWQFYREQSERLEKLSRQTSP